MAIWGHSLISRSLFLFTVISGFGIRIPGSKARRTSETSSNWKHRHPFTEKDEDQEKEKEKEENEWIISHRTINKQWNCHGIERWTAKFARKSQWTRFTKWHFTYISRHSSEFWSRAMLKRDRVSGLTSRVVHVIDWWCLHEVCLRG